MSTSTSSTTSTTTGGQDRLAALHEQISDGVAALVQSEAWRTMLDTAAKFHSYSLGNLLLIALQAPQATRVAGFRTWQSLGRQVRKGERGIAILAPCTYRPKAADRAEPPAPAGPEPTTCSGGAAPAAGGKQVRGFRAVHVFDLLSRDCRPRPVVCRVGVCGVDCLRDKGFAEEDGRHPGELGAPGLEVALAAVEGDGCGLSLGGVQDDRAVAEFAGAGFQCVQHSSAEPTPLQFRQDAHALDLGGVGIISSQRSHRDDLFVEDADEELAARVEVDVLDPVEVLIPWTVAGVGAGGFERDVMQPPDVLVVGALVAADQQGHGDMSPPPLPWTDGGQVRTLGILGFRALAVIAVPASAVLVRHGSPAPVGQGHVRDDAELLGWVDAARRDGAQVQPAVTEVELVDELLASLEPSEGEPPSVQHGVVSVVPFWVGLADPVSVGEVELVQMASVPAGERVIDRCRELVEAVGAGGGEDPSRPGPQLTQWPSTRSTRIDSQVLLTC